MELSKEVHGLLDRIKRLSNAQKTPVNSYPYDNTKTFPPSEEIDFNPEDILTLDDFDVSDRETWLYVSEYSEPSSGTDISSDFMHPDFIRSSEPLQSLEEDPYRTDTKKPVDTRTFTRPKKRISRPSLESINDSYNASYNTKIDLESIKIPENPFSNFSTRNDVSISTGPLHFKLSDPVMNHSFDKILLTSSDRYDSFQNMSPPSLMNSLCSSQFTTLMDTSLSVSQTSVPNDNFLSDSSDHIFFKSNHSQESFNESLPQLRISTESVDLEKLDASSSSENQMKKFYFDKSNDLNFSCLPNQIPDLEPVSSNLNITYEKNNFIDSKSSINLNSTYRKNSDNKSLHTTFTNKSDNCLNTTFSREDPIDEIHILDDKDVNSTYISAPKLNSTYSPAKLSRPKINTLLTTIPRIENDKTIPKLLNKTNTFTRKTRNITNLPETLKKSCPDINRIPVSLEKTYNRTFQKLSDSQPDLAKDVQQTILNQSLELMADGDIYNHRSGSIDSLDDKSSSVSNSSKESGSKNLNMADLDNLARLQEQSLQQVMSTPKLKSNIARFWDGDAVSPIHKHEEYLSEDSDMSEPCVTARSSYSQNSASTISSRSSSLTKLNVPRVPKSNVTKVVQPNRTHEVSQSQTSLRNLPTMIVKPLEIDRTFKMPEKPQAGGQARPRMVRASGLPRPTSSIHTGIPRPTSRIPAPRLARPQLSRPMQRPPPKSEWGDSAY